MERIKPGSTLYDGLGAIFVREGKHFNPKGGNCRLAIELIENKIRANREIEPTDYFWLGAAYMEIGNTDAAIQSFRAYIEHSLKDPAGYLSLGSTLTRHGNCQEVWEEGRLWLEQGLKMEPENIGLLNEMALNCLVRGDRKGFVDYLTKVALSSPREPGEEFVIASAKHNFSKAL